MFRALAIALAVMGSASFAHAQAYKPRTTASDTTAQKKPVAKPKPAAKKPPPKVAAAKKSAAKPKPKPVARRPPPSEPRPGSPDYVHFSDDE